MSPESRLAVRIYYEDTDCGGVVYYANYLGYFERGRTEYLRERGIELRAPLPNGIGFVVARAEVDYRAPAHYGDLLEVETRITQLSRASMTFAHRTHRAATLIAEATVVLVCVADGRPCRIPDDIRRSLADV